MLAEHEGTVAKVVTWAAGMQSDMYGPGRAALLDDLWECCRFEGVTLEALAGRLRAQSAGGSLDRFFEESGYVPRMLLLDSVSVAPRWRGRGIGLHLAAQSLLTAGAFDSCSVIAALASSRPEVGGDAAKQRSRRLLRSLGLTETGDDLWVGSCTFVRPGDTIIELAEAYS